jgi:ABC-type xylose transport system permease subunit
MEIKDKQISKNTLVLISILCIVPVLGGIIGLVVAIAGIFVYRSTPMIIIGIAGILITLGGVLYLRYYETHRGPFDDSRIKVSKDRLEDIVKELELYKVVNGYYPENLNYLQFKGVSIIDQLQQVNRGQDQGFYYKLNSGKYFLFSRGFDGVPFTMDDIYPDILGIDPNKIGLIMDSSRGKMSRW